MLDVNKNLFFLILFIILFGSGYVFFKSPFEFYFHYIFLFPLCAIFVFEIGVPKFYVKLFAIPLLIGLIHVALGNNNFFTFFKIFAGISISILFFYCLIEKFNFNTTKVFDIYCKACWLLCVIAIFQIASFIIGFESGYNFFRLLNKWGVVRGGIIGFRVNSILSEPTYLATSLSPAVYISIRNLIMKNTFFLTKFQSIVVIIISILTTSTIGYLGIIISIILSLEILRLRYIFIAITISLVGYSIAYNNVSDFSSRVNSAKGLWIEEDFNNENTNNSSFVLYNNLHIAKKNLMKYPLFGTGLGSHETAFKNFTLTKSLIQYDFEFNVKDGNSLFVRLCTETGVLGLFFIFIIIFNGFIYNPENNSEDLISYKIISQALFVFIILVLIRQGNYMLNGLPFMFLIYHFNKIAYNEKLTL